MHLQTVCIRSHYAAFETHLHTVCLLPVRRYTIGVLFLPFFSAITYYDDYCVRLYAQLNIFCVFIFFFCSFIFTISIVCKPVAGCIRMKYCNNSWCSTASSLYTYFVESLSSFSCSSTFSSAPTNFATHKKNSKHFRNSAEMSGSHIWSETKNNTITRCIQQTWQQNQQREWWRDAMSLWILQYSFLFHFLVAKQEIWLSTLWKRKMSADAYFFFLPRSSLSSHARNSTIIVDKDINCCIW